MDLKEFIKKTGGCKNCGSEELFKTRVLNTNTYEIKIAFECSKCKLTHIIEKDGE